MTAFAPTSRTPATFTGALDLTLAVLQRRYTRLLAPYVLVGALVLAVLLLGGAMAPEVTPLLAIALFAALIGVAVSFTAASIAAHRIAGALLVGNPNRHLDGELVGGTLDEVRAAHERIVPILGLGIVGVVGWLVALTMLLLSSIFPPLFLVTLPTLVYVGVRLSLAMPVVVMGENNPLRAVSRSWQLTTGHFWIVLGLSLTVGVVGAIVGLIAPVSGAVLGETVGVVVKACISVLWLPVGPASTMAVWAMLRRREEPETRAGGARPLRPGAPEPVARPWPNDPSAANAGQRLQRRGDRWVLADDPSSEGTLPPSPRNGNPSYGAAPAANQGKATP
jgi:hypothetical protein